MLPGVAIVSTIERYEILVLGSGEAGKCIAWTLAKAGSRAAVVERGLIIGEGQFIAPKTIEVRTPEDAIRHLVGERGLSRRGYALRFPMYPGCPSRDR